MMQIGLASPDDFGNSTNFRILLLGKSYICLLSNFCVYFFLNFAANTLGPYDFEVFSVSHIPNISSSVIFSVGRSMICFLALFWRKK